MGENKGKGGEKEKKPIENQKEKNGGGSEKKKESGGGGGAEKKEEGPPKVVLKVDMHCEGCASKIKRWAKGFEGVEGVTMDMANNKLTVIGSADPWKLREHLESKTRKKVEIVSPLNPPKKESSDGKKSAASDGQKKSEAAGDSKDKQKPPSDKKSKEPVASTVVLRIRLHCDGCIQRIKKTIFKIKGVQDVSVDAQKDLVTLKGTMDVNSLPSYLKDKLNRGVEIVSATAAAAAGGGSDKKEKSAAAGGGEKKEKGGGGGGGGEKKGNGGGGGGGEKKGKDGGGDGGKKEDPAVAISPATAAISPATAAVVEANRMEYYGGPYGYRAEMLHAPQLFSDENPNACSVM